MADYVRINFQDAPAHKTTPTSAANFNHMEEGIVAAQTDAKCLVISIASFSSLPQTVSDAKIESDMVCVNSVLSNPFAQTGDWTVDTSSGSVTVSGTISGSTTLTLYLMKSR